MPTTTTKKKKKTTKKKFEKIVIPAKDTTLVIVESPTKARTIERFLGKDYTVTSSYGHVRDLPSSTLGVDTEHNFEPKYVTPRKIQKHVTALKKAAKEANDVILATDEDREGEAIAWHLANILELEHPKRIVFHEITKTAIADAIEHPRAIKEELFHAQQARRVLDRLVGYKLSPFLWKKVMRGLSAGRVQSVALRLILEREAERKAFKEEEYWTIDALLGAKNETFEASCFAKDGKTLGKFAIPNEEKAKEITTALEDVSWEITDVSRRDVVKTPRAPFITSTLQQEASRRFGFSAKQTMYIAQQLYEGIELKDEASGLITYMRTDSTNIAPEAMRAAEGYINNTFGEKYVVKGGRTFKKKTKGAQEAHEAIRPTDILRTPDEVKAHLDKKQYQLYTLIWQRFIASQMQPAVFTAMTVDITAGAYTFRATGQHIKFDGHLKVWPLDSKEHILPELKKGEKVDCKELEPKQHFTQPPARYSEAMLIKALEKHGIGRPSTYAPIMSTLEDRGYVQKDENKKLAPTEVGETVNELIVQNFPDIVDIDFTAEMEEQLDTIAEGKKEWVPIIKNFYVPFEKNLEEKMETVKKRDMTEETDEICEKCGKPMVIKYGRFGKFMACSGFPDCKNTASLPPVSLNIPCPECGKGELVERMTRKRRQFFGCSRYPECEYATWKKPETTTTEHENK